MLINMEFRYFFSYIFNTHKIRRSSYNIIWGRGRILFYLLWFFLAGRIIKQQEVDKRKSNLMSCAWEPHERVRDPVHTSDSEVESKVEVN